MNDLISRQAAIDALREMAIALYGYDATSVISCAIYKLQNLPSREPESCEYWDAESNYCALNRSSAQPVIRDMKEVKNGAWTVNAYPLSPYKYRCSVCGAYHRALYDYCPTCGSDMKGELNNE